MSLRTDLAQHIRRVDGNNQLSPALRRLQYLGKVRAVGEAFDGGHTWALTNNT